MPYKDKEKAKEYQKANRHKYLEKHKSKFGAEYMRQLRKLHPERDADYSRKSKYGISKEEFSEMLLNQGGVCAICKGDNSGKTLRVDHNHVTGKIRGLLCSNCNVALGMTKEDRNILEEMIDYLDRN